MTIGKLFKVPLREVWPHEAHDFTVWLEENIDILNEVIDLELVSVQREQAAGTFSVDLLAEDSAGKITVIENQLEKSDHDHLGKLITYLANFDAEFAIWIVSNPRPEHINAVTWLNESSSGAFYLIKIEAVKIGNSEPAPLMTLIVGPSEESRAIGSAKREFQILNSQKFRFWDSLVNKGKGQSHIHDYLKPNSSPWIYFKDETPGIYLAYNVNLDRSAVAVYIDHGFDCEEENKSTFFALKKFEKDIENRFGGELHWFQKPNTRIFRIQAETGKGYRDDREWDVLQEKMISSMIRLEDAVRPFLRKLIESYY